MYRKFIILLTLFLLSVFILAKSTTLKSAINSVPKPDGRYAIAIKNFKTGEVYFENEHTQFFSASVYKLWVMGAVFKEINAGKLSHKKVLTESVALLRDDFGIVSAQKKESPQKMTFTVGEAIDQMITTSDNYATLLLWNSLSKNSVSAFLKTLEMNETFVEGDKEPVTSVYDSMKFFEALYKKKIVDADASYKMMDILKRQENNVRIPKLLPKELKIAHKTGGSNNVKHDTGIVFTKQGDYIIAVFTDGAENCDQEDYIAKVSKAAYDYFSGEFSVAKRVRNKSLRIFAILNE